ncbi:hypothetical protein UA45_18670 [Morganella morganii]|uniref:Uncharacterized protein n=1 Tax=Morganella morganii TaxID=582 RepID=A0A0D8L3E8_MORMO|nr:hypothetical protein UA45_18670 [Morganella morganii]
MIHKHIGGKKNQRNVKNSLDYLLRVNKKDEQQFVKVLSQTDRKDIEIFNEYIKAKDFKNPYITGVLSFEEQDIDNDLKTKIMNEFEEMLFIDVEPENRPPIMWIQHTDKNRLELNYTTFNSLQDRRHYQCYYHLNDKTLFNSFCEKINYENNISSVLDVKEHKASNTLINNLNNKIPENKKELVNKLQEEIIAKIINEELNNREELISFIQSKNIIINRVRENAISIKFSKDDKPISLKGDIYEQNRDYKTYRTEPAIDHRTDKEYVERQLNKHREDFNKHIKARSERNRTRFNSTQKKNKINAEVGIVKANDDKDIRSEISNNNNLAFINQSILHDNSNYINKEDLNNEQNIRNNEDKERERNIRSISITAIKTEQQRINQIAENIRARNITNAETITRIGSQQRFTRNYLNRFVQLFREVLRPFHAHERKNEIRATIKERAKIKRQNEKQIKQEETKRIRYQRRY